MEISGICLGVIIGIPIGFGVLLVALGLCAAAARADKANEEAKLMR